MGGQVICGVPIEIRGKSSNAVVLDFTWEFIEVKVVPSDIDTAPITPIEPLEVLVIPTHYSKRKIKQSTIKYYFKKKKRGLRLSNTSTFKDCGVKSNPMLSQN